MRRILGSIAKSWWWSMFGTLILGMMFGSYLERNRLYNDCRYAGVTRIGEAAFKCDQFSKVVLLTPDEQAKKEEKKK